MKKTDAAVRDASGNGSMSGSNGGTDACTARCSALVPSNVDLSKLSFASAADVSIGCGMVAIDTSGSTASLCGTSVGLMTQTQSGGPEVAVLAVKSLTIVSGSTLRATGDRPLVIVAQQDVTIEGTVDVSADHETPGAGGNVLCSAASNGADAGDATSGDTGGGGGGGGGFGSAGGKGGNGDNGSDGAAAGAADGSKELVPLRGGCAGGRGGRGWVQNQGRNGGAGGGAIQISATGKLSIGASAIIAAAGGGGRKGNDDEDGGGGGGSGGGILLEATHVEIDPAAWITANGGGGASGQSTSGNNAAHDGANGPLNALIPAAAAQSSNGGGGGGTGATQQAGAGAGGDGSTPRGGAGGGGGGGGGRIRINGAQSCDLGADHVTPAASTACP